MKNRASALYFTSFQNYAKDASLRTSSRVLFKMKIIIIIITWIFTLFPNLKAKETYNWWLTRRVWGFR